MRDLKRLIAIRDDVLEKNPAFDQDGLALVWLRPWTGASSLQPTELDPYFIEICRRVRLVSHGARLSALAAGSKVARISFGKDAKGLTGDPWTPTENKDGEVKALTIDARGFTYKRMADILFEKGFRHAPLQQIGRSDPQGCSYVLICRALARGQGKTEGLHERRIVVPPKAVGYWRSHTLEPLALLAQDRIEQAGKMRGALRYALMMLFQSGPERTNFKQRHKPSEDRAGSFLDMFEAEIDRDFFERLFEEIEIGGDTDESLAAQRSVRTKWLIDLRARAEAILKAAEAGSPTSAVRHYRSWVRADQAFKGAFLAAFRNPYFPRDDNHAAA
jgi:CRISPR system Cascade subunit CasA